jgi:hypothetical protein
MGWVDRPEEVEALLSRLPKPTFSAAAPGLKGFGEGQDLFFWEAEEKVLPALLPCINQTRGTCVACGLARSVEDVIFAEIVLFGEAERFVGRVSTEVLYWGSRVEIGRGELGGPDNEGSLGSWGAEFVRDYGVLPRGVYGSYNLMVQDDDLACSLSGRGKGVPDELEPLIKQHPITAIAQIRTINEARDALASGKPVTIASMQGWTETRDANGFCKPKGQWAHQMCLRGVGVARGGQLFFVIQQSWGDKSPKGPDKITLESGRTITLPVGCFGVFAEDLERQTLRSGDCWTYAGLKGWRKRHLHI